MTPSGISDSFAFKLAELEQCRLDRAKLDAESATLFAHERAVRRLLHGEALLDMLQADPLPTLRYLGLRDGAQFSEVQGFVTRIMQDVADALVEEVMRSGAAG